jgi:hypothetical protein
MLYLQDLVLDFKWKPWSEKNRSSLFHHKKPTTFKSSRRKETEESAAEDSVISKAYRPNVLKKTES